MDYRINDDKQIKEAELSRWEDIAVIGVGIKVSNAETLEEYWSIFENQIDCMRDIPSSRRSQVENYAKIFPMMGDNATFSKGTYLEDIDEFDYPFFKITPREAELMEPAHRIILQTIYNTIVDAGYTKDSIAGTKTGVFLGYTAGSFKDNYLVNISFRYPELLKYGITANMPALMPSRISQMLDLHGPTMILDTACSSSLLAVHLACESILNGASEMAVAGGIKLNLLPLVSEDLKLGIESVDDRTRAFDNDASGTGIGEGAFCVLLKPLKKAEQEGDHIYGVIKASATNHDGTASGLTAPNPSAQTEVIDKALRRANMSAEDISYVEVHGTATILGDPIEFQGLNHAYKKYTNKKQFCGLSASKSNLGHLYECAGVAALVKALAALVNKRIPGSKHFNTPNLKIDFSNSPFYVNKFTKKWDVPEGKKRTCGVSAFGLSGTNCHLILQEYSYEKESKKSIRTKDILCLSAFSKESLHSLVKKYREYIINSDANLEDIVYNINVYRQHYKNRMAIVFFGKEDLLNKLKKCEDGKEHDFIFYSSDKLFENERKDSTDLCTQCNEFFKKSKRDEKEERDLSEKFCQLGLLYVSGYEINWGALYTGMESDKISIPSYPFQKYHMWLKESEAKVLKQEVVRKVEDEETFEARIQEPVLYQKVYLTEPLNKKAINSNVDYMKDILVVQCGNVENDDVIRGLRNIGKVTQLLKLQTDGENVEEVFMQQLSVIDFTGISKIVVCFGVHQLNGQTIPIEKAITWNMLAIICLYKCIGQDILDSDKVQLYCVTKDGFYVKEQKNETKPEFACIAGVCKAFNRGFRNIKALCIDTDDDTKNENIIDEIMSDTLNDIILYRNNVRYIEGIQELPEQTGKKMVYRKNGVYLITGGLGGIGYETAKELLKRAEDSTIILIGKTELPPKEEWTTIISSSNLEMSEKLKRLTELQQYGNVVYLACDVSNQEEVVSVVHNIHSKYGTLNGIIHAAGVGGGTDLQGLNETRIKRIVSSKVVGAYSLDQATANERLDFFVVFSSISTVFSSADLPDYIVANLFLEEFAYWRAQKREGVSLAIEWSTWAETGMSVKNNFTMDTMFKAIKTKQGMNLLFSAIASGFSNVIAGQLNFESKIIFLINKYPVHLSDYIIERLNEIKNETNNTSLGVSGENTKRKSSYAEIENNLCKACCKVLGYSTINITDNFFELGADSIMLSHIFNEIDVFYPGELNITDLFAYPTVELLTEYLADKVGDIVEESEEKGKQIIIQQMEVVDEDEEISDKDIAIIGVGMNLPNASNLDEYWEILNNNINVVREIPDERSEDIVKHLHFKGMKDCEIDFNKCGYLDRINSFDNAYFGMSPKESSLIEPAGRLFLQACATAIEDAGYGGDSIRGTQTGVFLGYTANIGNAYSRLLYEVDQDLFGESMPINQVSMMASRVAYVYDLKGPSMVIDTACSSSLVALHTACKQIRSGECDMALAGGVSIMITPLANGATIGFESPEFKTRAFADNSSGTAVGEGVCAILLKSLKKAKDDGDSIYAVIKGSAINQDGRSQGIAAPNYLAQSSAIKKAWEDAGVDGQDISYIEAHGTGTQLGDPIEIRGITHAFSSEAVTMQSCGIGSLKTNIGHLNEASGLSGILKIILMLKYKTIPASLEFKVPNSNIDFTESPVYVVSRKMPLKPKRNKVNIGINGFGMSGTNCHVILCEPPIVSAPKYVQKDYIFTASAKTKKAFLNIVDEYLTFLEKNQEINLADFCYTANVGRTHFTYRLAVYVHTREELVERLRYVKDNYLAKPEKIENYIGDFCIVPENKTTRLKNEITSRMQKEMTVQADMLVESIKNTDSVSKSEELLSLYLKGATVNWINLYAKERYHHIHIPVYPFERNHCWYKVPMMEEIEPVFHYEKRWVLFESTEVKELSTNEYTIVFMGKDKHFNELPHKLEECGVKVCVVKCGQAYEKINEEEYFVGSSVEDYTELFKELKNKSISRVIHAKSIYINRADSDGMIEDRLNEGFFDIINIMKGMSKARFNSKFDFIFIANSVYRIIGDEKLLLPENATLLSIGTVIEQENPNINCYAIDIDTLSDSESICKLIMRMDRTYLYGIRSNEFFQMEAIPSELPVVKEEVIKSGQVYLITGGTGGIGVEIANYVSNMNSAIIVLVSRSGFEEQENWEHLKSDSKYAHSIEIFEEIQRRGSTLCFEKCDVSNKDELAQCINRVHQKYGKIKGIFHAAGISGAGYILRKEKDSFVKVIKPKLYGTVYLDELTMNDNMDFMMICSSAVTDSGEAGQSDYVAANSYLDAFTDYRNVQGRATYTVNWVSWKEAGMAVRHGINVDGVTRALTTREAIEALDKMLKSTPRRAMIGQYNTDIDLSVFARYCRYKTNHDITNTLEKLQHENQKNDINSFSDGSRDIAKVTNGKMMFIPKSDKVAAVSKANVSVRLTGDEDGGYTELEYRVGNIYGKTLGYEEINIYDNFFELGGDSIMLSGMFDLICDEFDEIITVADLFEYTNIRDLSKLIQQNLPEENEKVQANVEDVVEKMIDNVLPLSMSQQRIYYESRLSKDKLAYNNPFLCDLTGLQSDLDISDILNAVIERHEILRSKFVINKGRFMQKVDEIPNVEIDTVVVDSVYDVDYAKYLKQFNLMKDWLFNLTLFTDKENHLMLLFDIHHILLDGYASGLLQSEMLEYYTQHSFSEPAVQYREYIDYEQRLMKSDDYKKLQNYWMKKLSGYEPVVYFDDNIGKERKPEYYTITLDNLFASEIQEISGAMGKTTFSMFLFIINLLASVLWQMNDNVFLIPAMNRNKPQFKKIIGVFINLIPIRSRINNELSVMEQIQSIFVGLKEDLEHQSYQYNDLVQSLNEQHKYSKFNMYIDFEDESLKLLKSHDLTLKLEQLKYDLDIVIKKRNGLFDIEIAYNSSVFAQKDIVTFAGNMKSALSLIKCAIKSEMNIAELKEKMLENIYTSNNKDVAEHINNQ